LDTICAVPFVNVYDTSNSNSSESDSEHHIIKNILKINSFDSYANKASVNMSNLQDDSMHRIHVWVYVPKNPIPPDASHPILQSYVDIIMRGCFNTIGEPMARSFISTTTGWSSTCQQSATPHSHYWVNDRDLPMYKRADRIYSILNAAKIDHVIFDELSSMKPCTTDTKCTNHTDLSNHTMTNMYRRSTYDPLFHLQQLTRCLEEDYDSVHPMAFQHFASQIQMDHTSKHVVG
jgi:hypothetical protein